MSLRTVRRRSSLAVLLAAVVALGAVPLPAQEEAAQPGEVASEEKQELAEAEAPETSRYQRESYRDPFRSLLEKQKEEKGPRPPGPPGMLIEEIDLVGILSGPKGAMILIIGSDGLGYSLTEGAQLYDGRVLKIDQVQRTVMFRQDVNDPTRIKPYRDIERRLDSAS